jgi:L-threonylcarbamoyladenylate synthase
VHFLEIVKKAVKSHVLLAEGSCSWLNFGAMDAILQEELDRSLQCLRAGGVLLYPTDTIWGLGCDPWDLQAVNRIYEIKLRPADKSLILLASTSAQVAAIVGEISLAAWAEMEAAGDRPLTIVYPAAADTYRELMSADGSIAIRITRDPFCKALIDRFGRPITSTSANVSGSAFGGNFWEIPTRIVEGVDHVVAWRREESMASAPSRIVKLLADGKVQEIRP